MGISREDNPGAAKLSLVNEPKKSVTSSKSDGTQAFDDALKIVIFAWLFIFIMVITLHSHIV